MISLYKLGEMYRNVDLALIESDGEITEDIELMLSELSDARDDKLTAIACLIKNSKAEMEAYKEEERRLKELRSRAEKRIEKLEELAKFILPTNEIWNSGAHKLFYRQSKAVEIHSEEKIPADYMRTKTIVEPNKTAIGAAIEAGVEVPGAILATRQNLQVK